MKALAVVALIGAGLVGAGYVIGKRVMEKRNLEDEFESKDFIPDAEDEFFDEERASKGKIRKAAMFAVGAVKTSADKLGETFNEIKTKDMVKKGEDTVESVKVTGENIKSDIKKDIEDLKHMVSSINNEEKTDGADDLFKESESDIPGAFEEGENK